METYDDITADSVEVGDQIQVNNIDPIEVSKVIDSGDSILISGYSHMTGDTATYILTPETVVGLWTA